MIDRRIARMRSNKIALGQGVKLLIIKRGKN